MMVNLILKTLALAFVAMLTANNGSVAQGNDGDVEAHIAGQLSNNSRPSEKVPFPTIEDWQTLKITLNRTRCLGACPSYRVEINGDGVVSYEGRYFVAVAGKHKSRVPVEKVRDLYEKFVRSDFFWTFDEYLYGVTDNPTYTVTISFDNYTKKVIDYVGLMRGMPKEVSELENSIDVAADISKWLKGDESTFASLAAENWDFGSQEDANLKLIESAATAGNLHLLRQFLAAGVRADTVYGCRGMQAAALDGHASVMKELAYIGAPVYWDGTCNVLRAAAMVGVPAMVQAVLARKPDVNRQDSEGLTPLMIAASGVSLAELGQDYAATVRLLIEAGADVNLRDNQGRSAIMMVESADGMRALLRAGATDINMPRQSYNAEVIQVLMEEKAGLWRVDKDSE